MTRAVRDPGPSPVLLFLLVVGLVPTVHPSTLVLLSQPQPEEPLRTKTESRIRPRRDTVERHAGLPLILKGAREPDTNSFPFQGRHFPTCSQRPKMKVQTDGNGALTMHAENGTKVPMGRVEIIPDSKLLRVVPGTRYKVGAIRIPKDGVVLKSEKIHDINKTTPSLRKNEANGMNMRVSVWPDKVGADIRDRKVGGGSTRDPYPERRNIRETDGRRLRMRDEQIGEEQVKRRFSDRNKRMIGERINVKNSMRESRESDEIGLRIVGKRRRSIGPPAPHKGVEGSPFIRPKQDIEVLTGHDRFKKHNINGAETADHGHLRRLVPREDFSTTDSLMEKNNNNSSMKKRLIEVGNKYKSRKYKYENSAAQENNPSDGDRTVLKYTYELRKETGKHSSLRGNSYRPERKAKLERSVGGPEGNLMENGNQLLKDSVIRVDFKEDYNVKTADEEYVDRRITNTDVSVIASEPMRNNVGFNQRTAPKFVLCCSHENGRDPTLSDSMKSAHASESGEQGLPNFRGEDGGFERLTQSNASVRSSSKPVEEQDVLSGLNRKRRSAPKSTPRKCGDADVNSRVGFLRDRRLKLFSTSGDCEQRGARPAFSKPSPAMLLATTGSSPLEGDEALWKFLHELRGLSKKGGRKKSSSRMSHDYPDYLQDQAPEGREEVGGGVVSILGLFELSQWGAPRPEGLQELAAAQLAVEHVNEHQLLGPATLKLVTNDTKCDPGVAVDAFFHALYTRKEKMVMLLGSACSEVTESLAKVTPFWNMLQVSFGSVSAALSDRREFPLFYRTVSPDSSHNSARVAFVNRFNWKTVTALSQNEDVYSLGVNGLVTELERANITCKAAITFAETDFKDQLKRLRDLDTRIIIGSFSPNFGPKIFCEAYRLGMYGADYAWILQGRPENSWWRKKASGECSARELNQAIEGVIFVASFDSTVGDTLASTSGLGRNELERLLEQGHGTAEGQKVVVPSHAGQSYVRQSYDAVWAMALALNATQRTTDITKFNYGRKDMVKSLFRNMATLKFTGVSGPIAFNGPDRVGITAFYQVQKGEARTVGLYDATQRLLELPCAGCLSPVWQGGQVPIAERKFKLRIVTIEPAAFLTISCLASVGITLAIMFLVFNLHFRKLKYIKLSSPKMNNMAVVGCILVYTAVILLGLDNATLRPDAFPIVCTARVYLLSAGFSMAFGSMFTKTYRVHRIFTRSSSSVVKNKMLQDTQLISLICVLLVVDGLIVTLWVTFDPMERHLRNLSLEISSTDRSVVYQPQVEECGSQYTHSWLGVLYAYKGLLLIVGVYMAWETRHVKIPALNDSKYIGLSVYSAVITSVLVVVFANLISERATMAFLTITALILVSTTTSLCILFIPKIHAIMAHTDRSTTIDPIMQSMGLKIEYNTRRFVTDDRREVHYRVEVQNRVYKRDLLTLDNEISKLEKQLYNCTSDASSRSSIALKGEMEEGLDRLSVAGGGRGKSPSVSGGIPMLLLSVLPPVIPRASWPSSENCVQPPSRNLAFNSEPKLDQTKQFIYFPRGSRHQSIGCTEDKESSVFAKFLNVIAPRSSRKSSGIASALRAHMGYMAGIIPPTEGGAAKQRDDEEEGSGRCLSQPRVSFSVGDKVGTGSGSSVFKERPKGSPRFPHRIVPTSSLNDLGRRGGGGPRGRRDSKWRSLEDASLSPTADLWPQPQQEPSLLAPNHR